MRTKEVEEAIKLLKTYENKLVYEIEDKDKIAVDAVLSYIEELEELPNKIRDKIKELEEKRTKTTYADEKFFLLLWQADVLKEIIGE